MAESASSASAASSAKTGVDDFLAAGGTVAELLLMARPYEPQDTARERLSRDEKLRHAIAELRAAHDAMPQVKNSECTDRATMRDFIRAAERSGKVVEDGVRVTRSARDGALATQASLGGWKKSVDRLEAAERIRRVRDPNKRKEQAASYVLLTPWGGGSALREQYGKKERPAGKETQGEKREKPHSNATYTRGVHATRSLPELRWPKVILYWERRDGRRVVADSHYVARLGKKRREIIAYLLERESAVDVAELMELFASPRARRRDFRSRILAPLEADGIVTLAGEDVTLADTWRDALDEAREQADEIDDAKRQAEKYARQRKSFRNRDKTPAGEEPGLRGKESVKEALERHRDKWEAERIEGERRKVGVTASTFLADELEGISGVRWQELRERWIQRGGRSESLRLAVSSGPFRFGRESADGERLYVYPAGKIAPPRRDGEAVAVVVSIRPGPFGPDEWLSHPLLCECLDCSAPMPKYVKFGGA